MVVGWGTLLVVVCLWVVVGRSTKFVQFSEVRSGNSTPALSVVWSESGSTSRAEPKDGLDGNVRRKLPDSPEDSVDGVPG